MYDVIVIGGGPDGYAAAIRASQLDAKVEGLDFDALVGRVEGVSNDIRMGMGGLLGNNRVQVIEGHAVFKGPKEIDVAGTTYQAESFIIATGSRLAIPDMPGLKAALLTSDQALRMKTIPASVLVYGAGPMEVEFATILSCFGSNVSMVSDSRRVLPLEDQDSNQRLSQSLRENGVTLYLGNTIASIKAVTGGFDCQLSGSKDEKVTVEKRFGYGESSVPRHPKWLQLPLGTCREGKKTDSMIRDLNLITVCESARCPNLAECFNRGTATFMILGSHCTRNCRFCAVEHGRPQPVDLGEPERLALAVQRLGLHYAVVTSVTRDDLSDGGASQFVRTIEAIRRYTPGVEVEVLIPDFKGSRASVESVCKAGPDMFNHNIETVPRLYSQARPQASFQGSLDVLAMAVGHELRVKSGMMLGLGETSQEIRATLAELRSVGCEYLTLGQYLAPSKAHIEPKEWLPVKTAKKNTHKSIQALCLLNFANTRQQGAIKEN